MLISVKTYEQLMSDSLMELEEAGISSTPGSIARLFLSVINRQLGDLYETLSINHANVFVSTAKGDNLDAIGAMLGCIRLVDETDDTYRYRITKQTLNNASANETAIRLAALSVDGVQDIILRPFALGAGSFVIMALTESEQAQDQVLEQIISAVKEKVGYGIKFSVEKPKRKEVKISVKLILRDSISDTKAQTIRFEVREAIETFFKTKSIAEPIIIDELTKAIMNVDPSIVSYICEDLKVDGYKVMFVNQNCEWNERFTISASQDAIIVA